MELVLARVGLHPDRVIYCEAWKDADVLPAMEEGLRHGGLAGAVGELVRLPLTPSRRSTGGGSLRRDRLRFAALGQRIGRSQWSIWTWDLPAGALIFCAAAGRKPTALLWRPTMRRVVLLFLPSWATNRLRRRNGGLS
jgi:hypothetical protein